jgi:hypothetical protein
MYKKPIIAIIVAVVVIVGVGGYFVYSQVNQNNNTAVTPPPPPPPAEPPSPTPPPPPQIVPPPPPPAVQPPPPPPTQNFLIQADDYMATPNQIHVSAGTLVSLVIKIKTDNVYYGGVEFKSSVVNTGAISPGGTKTVEFTANQSFELLPYWPASGVKKDYSIKINVH